MKNFDQAKVDRKPILINPHTIALIQMFTLPSDHISDMWSWEYHDTKEHDKEACEQIISQLSLGGNLSVGFMMALAKEVIRDVQEHDEDFGTDFIKKLMIELSDQTGVYPQS